MLAREAELARAPAQREHGHQVEDHVRNDAGERGQHERTWVLARKSGQRNAHAFLLRDRALERRRLRDLQAYVEAHEHEHRARDEGQAPAPGEELLLRERRVQCDEDSRRAPEAERRAKLREHSVEALLAARCILGGEQHGAAPFAA